MLKACSEENGMKFSEEQLDQLTVALYDDARNESASEIERRPGVSYEELREQILRHPGLLENISVR